MTAIDSPPAPQTFRCDAHAKLARIVAEADAKARTADKFLADRLKARTAVSDAEQNFSVALTEETAAALTAAKSKLQTLDLACEVLENTGGVAGARYRGLVKHATFEALAEGYAERVEALGSLLPKANTALAKARFAATEAGLPGVTLEFQPAIQSLRLVAETIIADRNDAVAAREWCLRWTPQLRMNRTYADLAGGLEAPLPA